jgi:hypothetical protein
VAGLVIAAGAAGFVVAVLGLGLAAWLANRDAQRLDAKVVELAAALRTEQKTNAELRGALHDLQAANAAWTRLLRPRHLDTTRPINGETKCI